MTYPATNFNEAVQLIVPDSNTFHDIINGDSTSEVDLPEGGTVPTVRKALADSLAFKSQVEDWVEGDNQTNYLVLRKFDDQLYWAPLATVSNPIPMGVTPVGDNNWLLAPTNDHTALINRDEKNSHPWSAITDATLNAISAAFNTLLSNTLSISIGATCSGEKYFYYPINEGVYYSVSGLTGSVDNISEDTFGRLVVTISSNDYLLEKINPAEEILNSTALDGVEVYQNCGFTDIQPDAVNELKEGHTLTVDSDSITANRKPFKAWSFPRGIKDSAVAGSFMLVDNVDATEPDTQVAGFSTIDDIGVYANRDAVAIFAQVNSADPILTTSSTTFTDTSITSADITTVFDKIDVGMIVDVGFGSAGWVGAVVTSKTSPDTLNISSWRAIDGVSGLGTTPTDGDTITINRHGAIWGGNFNAIIGNNSKGANQAIGLEIGLGCSKTGSGANSKGYYAVNLGGEAPEYAYTVSGIWQKGYTSANSTVYGFSSTSDYDGMRIFSPSRYGALIKGVGDSYIYCLDSSDVVKFGVKEDGILHVGHNAVSGAARINVRGEGIYSSAYDKTELNIFDPSTSLTDRSGFFISQKYSASNTVGDFIVGVGDSSNHQYNLRLQTGNTDRLILSRTGAVLPGADNSQTLGRADLRWSEVFAGNSVINTSDTTLKTFREGFSDAEKRVALRLKDLIDGFQWNESIEREESGGKKARIHIGIGAQYVGEAFEAEGLDPDDYAMFCYDEWEEEVSLVQTNIGEVVEIEKTVTKQKTEVVTKLVQKEEIKEIDGKWVVVKSVEEEEVEVPVFNTYPLYNEDGSRATKVTKDTDGNTIITEISHSEPVMVEVIEVVETPAEPVYDEVVKPAGSVYGVRLDQVLSFIIANT